MSSFFCANLLLALSLAFSATAHAQPKPLVLVEDTQDRWITFSDGSRLNHGFEVTHLLLQHLFESGRYQIIVPGISAESRGSGLNILSANSVESLESELKSRLPDVHFTYLHQVPAISGEGNFSIMSNSLKNNGVSSRPHILIRPRVETFLYASGERSNRIVYGFSPDRLNPYNIGKPGYRDNEFTITEYGKPDPISGKVCENVDFFGGQLNPLGFGPGMANFGANADEGIELFLFGYGFGFKRKTFDLKSEIVFDVELPLLNQKKEFRYELKGRGKDIGVSVSYQGISVGLEVARVKTLRMALQAILNNIVESFQKDIPATVWSTQISGFQENQWVIPAGVQQGIEVGLTLSSAYGSNYVVTKVYESYAFITPSSSNIYKPFVGEPLSLQGDEFQLRSEVGSRSMVTQSLSGEEIDLGRIELPEVKPEDVSPPMTGNCLKKKPSTWERLLMGLTWLYGYIRYKSVFDQPFESVGVSSQSDKIAILGSGIDPKESRLTSALDASGFDFISWDTRPSDELGMGTAAAVLLTQSLRDARLVSLKVLTPFGGTHSSAIYQALSYAAEREDIKTVLIPFKPAQESLALKEGIEKLIKQGKTVIVPEGVRVAGAVEATPTSEFKTRGLSGAKLRLSPVGAGVIQKFIQISDSNKNKENP